ncbi:MAG: hypothetical protein QG554_1088 [Pseudomonadota bacterium]|nr:hypothetical protein [Pseudomonadota bacterium]
MRDELLTLALRLTAKPDVDALRQPVQLGHEGARPCWLPMSAAPGDIRSKREVVVDGQRRVVTEPLILEHAGLARGTR